jgi:O-antigen ligase
MRQRFSAWSIALSLVVGIGVGFGVVISAQHSLTSAFLLIGVLTSMLIAILLPPMPIYALWGFILIVYVLYPSSQKIWGRIGDLPFEYIPLVGIFTVAWFSGAFRGTSIVPKRPKHIVLFSLAILLYSLISAMWVRNYTAWFVRLSMWIVYLAGFWGLVNNLGRMHYCRILQLIDWFLSAFALFALIGIVKSIALGTIGTAAHYSPLIRYPYIEAFIVLPFLSVAMAMYFVSHRLKYAIFAILYTLEVCLLFSRVGLTGLIITIFLMILIFRKCLFKSLPRMMPLVMVFLIATTIVLITTNVPLVSLGQRLINRISQISLVKEIWFGSETNLLALNPDDIAGQVWFREAIRIFLSNPWLGTGIGNYKEYYNVPPPFDEPTRARNFYASYLAEFGIIGFLPLFGFILSLTHFLWSGANRIANPELRLLALSFAVGHTPLLIMFLGEEFLSTPYVWFYWGLAVAFVLSASRLNKSEKSIQA